jgi:formamidopyrimidine-DNA glycosylase
MPELPEVETVARRLRAAGLVGRKISHVDVFWARQITPLKISEFQRRQQNAKITHIGRHGKLIELTLDNDETLFVHLRMTGQLAVLPQSAGTVTHTRLHWQLDKKLALRFDDARKFGRVLLTRNRQAIIGALGPDALDIDLTQFTQALRSKRRQLKPFLLDQSIIAGIGNIYADESLHKAKLHPCQLSSNVNSQQARALLNAIKATLRQAIIANGSSFDWAYEGGKFQSNFRVYQRTGQPCVRCQTPIQRIIVGQRSTHFCPVCQAISQKMPSPRLQSTNNPR